MDSRSDDGGWHRHIGDLAMKATSFLVGLLVAGTAGALAIAEPAPSEIPDDSLTPGLIASSNAAEVCGHTGGTTYSKAHRVTTAADKAADFAKYGLTVPRGAQRVTWEIDHRLPIALGGADDPKNRWPEPDAEHHDGIKFGYHQKDKLELWAWEHTCKFHDLSLEDAQAMFLAPSDWRQHYCQHIGGAPC